MLVSAARDALSDMPPRQESDLDPVTLHNTAIVQIHTEPSVSFEKLNFLLNSNPCPPETFGNLVLLYLKFEHYEYAADLLAQFPQAQEELLDPFVKEFVQVLLLTKVSPEEANQKLDEMINNMSENLRLLAKQVQTGRQKNDEEMIRKAIAEYDAGMEQ